jgi:signal transduction histidine kinase
MLSLMEDLLTLAKVGKLEPPGEPTDTNRVVHEVLAELSEMYAEVENAVRVAGLPEILVPDTLISQLFLNLVSNALHYAESSGQAIEVGGERSGRRVTYFVRDHGPGIPAEELGHIFEVFYRGAGGRHLQGTGVGLAIVQKIAQLYRGRAWVEETPGGGSTFMVELCEDEPQAPGG